MAAQSPIAPRCLLAIEAGYDYPDRETAVLRVPQPVENGFAPAIRKLEVKDHRIRWLLLQDLQGVSASN